jgi:hypothetical protein
LYLFYLRDQNSELEKEIKYKFTEGLVGFNSESVTVKREAATGDAEEHGTCRRAENRTSSYSKEAAGHQTQISRTLHQLDFSDGRFKLEGGEMEGRGSARCEMGLGVKELSETEKSGVSESELVTVVALKWKLATGDAEERDVSQQAAAVRTESELILDGAAGHQTQLSRTLHQIKYCDGRFVDAGVEGGGSAKSGFGIEEQEYASARESVKREAATGDAEEHGACRRAENRTSSYSKEAAGHQTQISRTLHQLDFSDGRFGMRSSFKLLFMCISGTSNPIITDPETIELWRKMNCDSGQRIVTCGY